MVLHALWTGIVGGDICIYGGREEFEDRECRMRGLGWKSVFFGWICCEDGVW